MTQLLEQALAKARSLSPQDQNNLAREVLRLVTEKQLVYQLTAKEEASFANSLAQAEVREFATDEEVKAIWARYSL